MRKWKSTYPKASWGMASSAAAVTRNTSVVQTSLAGQGQQQTGRDMTGYQMTSNILVLVVMTVQGWTKAAPVDANGSNAGVFYDQRQNGEYNIHVIVKDVDIVAFLGEGLGDYGDYDYSYDYHVPQNPWEASTTTQKTTSATSAEQNSSSSLSALTTPASSVSPSEDTTPTTLIPTSSTEGSTLSSRSSSNTTVECVTPTKEPEDNQQEQEVVKGPGKGRRRCSTGFVRDNRGRCRRLRRPGQQYTALNLPFGLRLFPRPVIQAHPNNS